MAFRSGSDVTIILEPCAAMPDKIEPVERELLTILEQAIEEERLSAGRYRRGIELSPDPDVRKMFERLVQDEEAHERVLKERYYEIKKRLGLKGVKQK